MDQASVLKFLAQLKSVEEKRNFTQSYDLIINLKNLDLKKPDQQIDSFVTLHYSTGKKRKIAAFVAAELLQQARSVCDKAITLEEAAEQYKEKKTIKKLAKEFDFFIAQANIMPKVALQFGKVLGPRSKMPNPKLGCVVPPQANLKQLYDKLQTTLPLKAKTQPVIQVRVGSQSMPDAEVADNIMTVYNGLVHLLPNEKNNVRSVYLKFTMGKPVRIDAKE
ncbi:MAG: 50S ribosomal protein L1 [Candidatus Woesearchaeota archaeon]